ncbi:MAG: hypothetical protein IJN87_09315 [Firmicutes bacterium]|nr:hypothetical protein [Bacillota bacterium]
MDIRNYKEHFALSIKANRLQPSLSSEQRRAAEKIVEIVDRIDEIKQGISDRNVKIVRMDKDALCFRQMSLLWWALSCVPLILLFWLHYSEVGNELLSDRMRMLEIYFPSAGIIAVGAFLGYFIWTHVILLVAAVVLTSAYPIYIFGSSINWMWVYIAVGTLVTICGRIIDYNIHIKKTDRWYKEAKRLQKSQSKLIDELAPLYLNIGKDDRMALIQKFPKHRDITKCWMSCAYGMSLKKKWEYIARPYQFCESTALRPEHSEGHYNKENRSVYFISEVTNQELGWLSMSAAEAEKLVSEQNLFPLFGMGIPEFQNGLIYEAFHHKWTESLISQITTSTTITHVIENEEKRKKKYELESKEYDYLGMSADWYGIRPENSAASLMKLDEYQSKKKALLDEMPDNYTYTRDHERTYREIEVFNHDIYVCLKVTSKDGALVGMYSSEHGVKCAFEKAREHVDIAINPLTIPSSPAQRGIIDEKCFGAKIYHIG